ncbi:MAG: hypothetical protein AVDCRST_MAG96-2728 [uncultured Segetibacter sp.]|uniref:Uncharacterized protein n=1 Tax=uncultured Segetibacter sp. TaxID=481133 RepID=A0A6J4T8R7_9BACT|nr:MAG: hypothetical protein AVDCRST_MAG96-2728 [uncultured Segetibacter sp.]
MQFCCSLFFSVSRFNGVCQINNINIWFTNIKMLINLLLTLRQKFFFLASGKIATEPQ